MYQIALMYPNVCSQSGVVPWRPPLFSMGVDPVSAPMDKLRRSPQRSLLRTSRHGRSRGESRRPRWPRDPRGRAMAKPEKVETPRLSKAPTSKMCQKCG